jgi:molybdopterin-guanine dinucleotide biosynthesis protein A
VFDRVSGILLAGGRSTRMGKDKALLPLPGNQDHSFVGHLASLLALFCREVLLVVRDSAQALEYEALVPGGVRILIDEIPGTGPLMGLYTGLKAMDPTSSHALLLAVDMPFVQPALLSFLLSQPLTGELIVPLVERQPQVLLAVYPRTALQHVEACLGEGRRDLRSLLAVCPVRYLEEAQLREVDPQLRSFVNVNTPEEMQRGATFE